eukprot:m.28440 g.28440  ORF g.28440 m.28440 type:complete len:90 (-) comp9040_c0_seq1:99-368(-)
MRSATSAPTSSNKVTNWFEAKLAYRTAHTAATATEILIVVRHGASTRWFKDLSTNTARERKLSFGPRRFVKENDNGQGQRVAGAHTAFA